MIKLYLNNIDVSSWCSLGEEAMVTLMTPAPMKAYLENKSESNNGKQVLISDETPALVDERDVTLVFNVYGKTQAGMLANFQRLVNILKAGKVDLKTNFEANVVYHLTYKSCTQLRTFFNDHAIFTITFNEPNPANRS